MKIKSKREYAMTFLWKDQDYNKLLMTKIGFYNKKESNMKLKNRIGLDNSSNSEYIYIYSLYINFC